MAGAGKHVVSRPGEGVIADCWTVKRRVGVGLRCEVCVHYGVGCMYVGNTIMFFRVLIKLERDRKIKGGGLRDSWDRGG